MPRSTYAIPATFIERGEIGIVFSDLLQFMKTPLQVVICVSDYVDSLRHVETLHLL